MYAFNVSVMDIMSAIKKSNLDIGAETMEINKVEYLIRGLGVYQECKRYRECRRHRSGRRAGSHIGRGVREYRPRNDGEGWTRRVWRPWAEWS